MPEHPPLTQHHLNAHHSRRSSRARAGSSPKPQAPPPADAPAGSDLTAQVYAMRETVTATLNVIVIVSASGEVNSDRSPRAFDSVHRVDHETTAADASKVSSQQTFPQQAYLPPPAAP